jgi:Uncharacterized conserved protein
MQSPTPSSLKAIGSLHTARAITDRLFAFVRPDCLYERPIPERHRLIFYVGHLEAFDWNLLSTGLGAAPFHPQFDRLFAFGIDPAPGDLPNDIPGDWPSLPAVCDYVAGIREQIDRHWEECPGELRQAAVEHRLMHAETLTYLLHNLPLSKLVPPPQPEHPTTGAIPEPATVDLPGGEAVLGRRRDEGFGWDNEYEEHIVQVPPFRIDKCKVTNGAYLDFVYAGGPPPHYWIRSKDGWKLRCLFSEIPLPLDWPVYVTQEQAQAYADWKGRSLPTEAQWHRAALSTPDGSHLNQPWGSSPPDETYGNFDFHRWDPLPVTAHPKGNSPFGASQMSGNGWEWTSSPFRPFPGFKPLPYYPGYSANFFDGEHYVLKGASPVTAAPFLRRSFRNWFRPQYPYVYATFRCVG